MKLYSVNTGHFKLDGGAMFGVVPKTLWQRTNPADENNMCSWAMRSLLIEDGNRLMLVDTGMGDKQTEKFFSYFYLHGDDSVDRSLARYGFNRADITDVFLTHLHFDHCGGCIQYDSTKEHLIPSFPNATYWSNEEHWGWATNPNPREVASFLRENILPIQESGQLKFLAEGDSLLPGIDIMRVHGHTEAQMLPRIKIDGKTLVFVADLIPSVGHLPIPYVMGYDVRPLVTMEEKVKLLDQAAKEDYFLFLEHDPINELCTVQQTEKGVRLKAIHKVEEVFG
ncbi:MAG: MBL fold metallo-hydrolase [Verrucomicrobia bacterium]|nr:MBL fold metallo-hydrolase [Verrucomicrobiota bacterium]MDA1069562.1 MBL fold metallo-hydrolase [Verrucomicrobiota bacterium]